MSMPDLPTTRYAQSGDLNIAYQVMGDGPVDLVFVPGLITHLEFLHEIPGYTECLRLLAGFARVATFDKSGQGLSDRASGVASIEQRMDDIRAVMDALGSTRAALLGCSEGAPISVVFAATYPERTSHLILFGGMARYTATPDYPFVLSEEDMLRRVEERVALWGTGAFAATGFLPSQGTDPDAVRHLARLERLTFSPGALRAMFRQNLLIDVRPILPTVRVPTLVLHRRADRLVRPENGRYLASQIPGAKYIEYDDCSDHLIFAGDMRTVCGDIEEFVTGERGAAAPDDFDRVLATVLFTDIVGSTRRAAEVGDQAWLRLLEEHDRAARRAVAQHRGTLVKTTGDGILATFDGPGRAIRCALAFGAAAARLGLPVRAGLHTGEIELLSEDVGGIAVHAAARVMARAGPGEVLVSRVVTDLVAGAGLGFSGRGTQELEGIPGSWDLFAVRA
jgi:class 3 adenylate cyclase/pimeloyl-ACP methyl ester carboxylesterase